MPHSTLRRTRRRKNLAKKWAKKNYNHYSHSSPTIDAAAWTQEAELSCSSLLCSWTNAQSPEGRSHHISCFDSLPILHQLRSSARADHAKKLAMSMSRSSSRPSTAGAGGALAATSADTTSWISFWPRHPASSNGR